jgi:EAL domain-containing protein (putative c-di-GMP-specific phosphodiesterase class I)
VSAGRVIVELTEREAINDIERLRRNVAALQHAGVRLAADDVGAGNAGLRLLSQLRFDIVKIDLSLVQDGAHHDSSRNVVRSLMDLATRQGAVAIAEGLETAEQLRSLQELGITVGQGYLLGRPGRNLGLSRVDIQALAAGALIVEAAPARRSSSPRSGAPEALRGSPA